MNQMLRRRRRRLSDDVFNLINIFPVALHLTITGSTEWWQTEAVLCYFMGGQIDIQHFPSGRK